MTKNPLPVAIHTASEHHTLGVMDMTRLIWEGSDYIPYVWSEWLTDKEGRLVVAEYEGRVVGMGKLSRLSSADWWLEGLRVHPEFEGRGIAQQIWDALSATLEEKGGGTVRMVTTSDRLPVHHMSEQRGFRLVEQHSFFTAPTSLTPQENEHENRSAISREAPTLPFRPPAPDEARDAAAFARSAGSTALAGEFMELEWRYAPPRGEYLLPFIMEHRAWWWRGRRGLVAAYMDTDDDEAPEHPHLSLVACSPELIHPLLIDIRRLYQGMGFEKVEWVARLEPSLLEILASAGFTRTWEKAMCIFEKSV